MRGDLRDAWRWWRRRPLHPTAVVLLLAVGITANAVVFTFVERLLVSPLAVDRPETLVSLGRMSWPNYRSFAERLDGTAGLAAFANRRLIRTANEPEPVRGAIVSADYFSVLGVPAALGRTFETADVRAAVISDAWWRAAHGADPAVLGRALRLNDVAVTIVGVAPPAFQGATIEYAPDVWIPFALQPEILPLLNDLRGARTSPWVTVFARRADGTPPARLRLAAKRLWDALVAEHPRDNGGKRVTGPLRAPCRARTSLKWTAFPSPSTAVPTFGAAARSSLNCPCSLKTTISGSSSGPISPMRYRVVGWLPGRSRRPFDHVGPLAFAPAARPPDAPYMAQDGGSTAQTPTRSAPRRRRCCATAGRTPRRSDEPAGPGAGTCRRSAAP